ncbi:hypothetical protein CC2G_014555 [Coprinopsis cinerea AmutBmut pab1-1]|nr:hypothetical protein CC2G_014555 [Coprinopsis cinerea AmutBmut pab1-1]
MIQLYPASQSQHSLSTAPVVLGAEATSPTEDDNFGMTSVPGTPVTVPTTPDDVQAPSLEISLSPVPPPGQSLERPTSSSIVLDPEYYWPSVKFSIQQHLVRLPVGLFIQHSEKFATDYGLSSCSSVPGLGREEREIVLDVEWEDFRNLLKALAPRSPFLEDKPTLSESE